MLVALEAGQTVLMGVRSVLVVGAGIAGSTLAYWLGREGMEVTVVEQATGQRSSGSPVDVRGRALAVVDHMNLQAPLRQVATLATTLTVLDRHGRSIGSIPTQANPGNLEVPRSDLAAILTSAARDHAEFVYDDTVRALHDDGRGVEVSFERGAERRFDLVVGADGLHSRVRRLVFGPESRFSSHLGLYIATTTLDGPADDPTTVVMHNAAGRSVAIHPARGREIAAFIFRHPRLPEHHDQDHHRRQLIGDTYTGMGWRVPELLERLAYSDDLYVDAVSRIRLDTWTRGRVVVLGDAASCTSLLGEGSSMAIVGAATLAQALTAQPSDPTAALQRYERVHRPRVLRHQRGAATTSHVLVPATRAGVTARNMIVRIWSTRSAA